MAGYREKIIYGLSKGISFIPTPLLIKLTQQDLILPFYHTISDEEMPHIKHLYPIKGVKAFIKDLDFLLMHFNPIDYSDFLDLFYKKQKPRKPSFLLSFDDGLKEFHDVIAPILLQKGIPAICFLNSGFIDNQDLFYRYKSSLLIDKIKTEPKLIAKISDLFEASSNITQNILSVQFQNKDVLDNIAKRIDYDFNDFLSTESPYLNSEQINSLISKGFHFGAHSINHPEYQYIELQEQIRQTKESVQFVSRKFSLENKIFSFPFTDFNVSKQFFSHLSEKKIVDITFGCAGQKKETIPNHFQRIPLEMNNLSGKQIINGELFYYLLKMPFGKNIINRS